jgi:hypothetical protein
MVDTSSAASRTIHVVVIVVSSFSITFFVV